MASKSNSGSGSYFAFGPVSRTHTLWSIMRQYLGSQSMYLFGWYQRRKLENDTVNCRRVQEEVLLERLSANQNTIYGKDHKFDEIKSREEFVQRHPLTRYPHYQRYISQISEAECEEEMEQVISREPIIQLSVTSSASGYSTLLPTTAAIPRTYFQLGLAPLYYTLCTAYPHCRGTLQKSLRLFFTPRWRETASGIPIAPNSSSPANSAQLLSLYTTPVAAYGILSEPDALYIYLLFALKDKMLGQIEANYASTVYSAFVFLREDAPYYLLFLELRTPHSDTDSDTALREAAGGRGDGIKLSTEDAAKFDACLRRQFFVYESHRAKGSIGPMRVHCCREGTFQGFVAAAAAAATTSQHLVAPATAPARQDDPMTPHPLPSGSCEVKVPRVLRNYEHLRFFMDHVL